MTVVFFCLGAAILFLGMTVAVAVVVRDQEYDDAPQDRSGWIYFITAADHEDAPVKVGMSYAEPCNGRLDDLRAMSPFPLRLLYTFWTSDRYEYEAKIHKVLNPHRRHGEWFDRDATLAFIDYIKGGTI